MRGAGAVFLALVLTAIFSGCSDHGDPTGAIIPPAGNDPVSFAADIQPIFDTHCVGCHGDGGNAGLDLRNGLSYANLVGVAANNAGGVLVVAGDAATSVLQQRLAGSLGGSMPPGTPLQASAQDLVAEWINDGAQEN